MACIFGQNLRDWNLPDAFYELEENRTSLVVVVFLAPVTNTLSKLVAKAQPFLLYQDLAEKGIIYLQQKISYPPLEILWECESMGLERSWRGRSTEQFYPSHHCSEPTQASYDSQPKNIIDQSSLA